MTEQIKCYKPIIASRRDVESGYRIGLRNREQGLLSGEAELIVAKNVEPKVIVQPNEMHTNVHGELWLWADGSLRKAPQAVADGSGLDNLCWQQAFQPLQPAQRVEIPRLLQDEPECPAEHGVVPPVGIIPTPSAKKLGPA